MLRKLILIFSFPFLSILLSSCREMGQPDYEKLPALTSRGVMAVIEIPAGTNRKVEYSYEHSRFQIDVKNGKERIIDFVPYPGNYGFVPSTLMDKRRGGDGDALDILVVCESLSTGDTISVLPIGTLMLEDAGEMDTKIIAVPADPEKQVIQATDFQTFSIQYSMAKNIIEHWFLNYKGVGATKLIGWRNDRYALQEIEKWKK